MTWCAASVFHLISRSFVLLSEAFFFFFSGFDDSKHASELAALIPSVLLHGSWISNKFSPFAFKDVSCQLRRGCQSSCLRVGAQEERRPLRRSRGLKSGFLAPRASPEVTVGVLRDLTPGLRILWLFRASLVVIGALHHVPRAAPRWYSWLSSS